MTETLASFTINPDVMHLGHGPKISSALELLLLKQDLARTELHYSVFHVATSIEMCFQVRIFKVREFC